MSSQWERESLKLGHELAQQFGGVCLGFVQGKHLKLVIRLADGRTVQHPVSRTPSDRRTALNQRSQLRHRLSQLTGQSI